MRIITKEELTKILAEHKLWLDSNGTKGAKADLSCADLSRTDLSKADLSGADLTRVDLFNADLSDTNLSGANLSSAYLHRADLYGADLTGANLSNANLRRADLYGADLSRADLTEAELSGANLTNVINMLSLNIVPQSGSFIAYKKLDFNILATLKIPAKAKRVNSTGRKCRAEFVEVLELVDLETNKPVDFSIDRYTNSVVYQVGDTVYPDKYNHDFREECTNGIHFFLTEQEAK